VQCPGAPFLQCSAVSTSSNATVTLASHRGAPAIPQTVGLRDGAPSAGLADPAWCRPTILRWVEPAGRLRRRLLDRTELEPHRSRSLRRSCVRSSGTKREGSDACLVVKQAMRQGWRIIKDTVYGFIEDEALSRGAAIAFYTATSIAPVLLIVVAIAGLAFGQDAAQSAITGQLSGLMGDQTAQLIQTAVASASKKSSGTIATLIGLVTLILTASGVFGEMQSALNAIWKAKPSGAAITRLI